MLNKGKSFTLIEVIIALFLITVGMLGPFALLQKTLAFTAITSSQLVASYLAQEGVELVRNIRDTNWLGRESWDNGLTECSSGCEFGSTLAGFARKITIQEPTDDQMVVSVEVSWQERGRTHYVYAQTELYDWK